MTLRERTKFLREGSNTIVSRALLWRERGYSAAFYLLVKARQGKLTQGFNQITFPFQKFYFGGFCFVYDE